MGLAQKKLSFEDFLDWENTQTTRHEFYRGEVFAMVGARRTHGMVAGNVFAGLKDQIKGSPCLAFIESMKVQPNFDSIFYPDVFVTCDAADLKTDMVFRSPTVIVEVLSESTQAYDRGLKFTAYRQIAALKEYLLIDPETREVQLYRRNVGGSNDGLFTLHDLTGKPQIELTSIAATLEAAVVFEGL
jgi:Uma2 family endonuclease